MTFLLIQVGSKNDQIIMIKTISRVGINQTNKYMVILKELDQKQDKILQGFIEEIQQLKTLVPIKTKETKQLSVVKSKTSQKKHQVQQNKQKDNKSKLKPFSADRYVRMCYLILRKCLYGLQKQKLPSPTEQLQFYYKTFEFCSIPSEYVNKIKIFQPIPKDEIPNYLNTQVIEKIQKLGYKVHSQLQNYFKSQISQKQCNIKRNQALYVSPLGQIVEFIQKQYCWDRWKDIYAKNTKKITNIKQQKQSQKMNMHQVLNLAQVTNVLNQLNNNKNFSTAKKELLNKYQIKQLQERQIIERRIGLDISAIEIETQKQRKQVGLTRDKTQSTSEQFSFDLQELTKISQIDNKRVQNILKETQELGYLKQNIEQFNYGLLSNRRLSRLECQSLGSRIRNGQVIHYFHQKQENKVFLESLMKVCNKFYLSEKSLGK